MRWKKSPAFHLGKYRKKTMPGKVKCRALYETLS